MSENSENAVSTPPAEGDKSSPGQDLVDRFKKSVEGKPAEVVGSAPEVYYCEEPGCNKKFTDKRKFRDHKRYHENKKEAEAAKSKPAKQAKTLASVKVESPGSVRSVVLEKKAESSPSPATKVDQVKPADPPAPSRGGVAPLAILGLFGLISLGLIAMSMRKSVEMTAGPVRVKVQEHSIQGTVEQKPEPAAEPQPEPEPVMAAPAPMGLPPVPLG